MRTSALANCGHTPVACTLGLALALSLSAFTLAVQSASGAALDPTASATGSAPAQAARTNAPAGVKGRYLIIIETSKAMEHRGVGALEGVRELLFTGMRGQLRDGDTVGLWTFNDQLQTGKFPLQQWSQRNARAIATRALDFVQSQRFEKGTGLETVLAAMHGVVSNSEFITIALITTGNEYVSGTPFDAAINQTFKNWQSGQQKKQMPMMTVLRARKGQYTDFAVTPLPFPIDIPPFPADLLVVQAAKPAQTNKPAPGPLIVSGPKAPPAQAPPKKTATSSVAPLIFTGPSRTNAVEAAAADPVPPPPKTNVAPQTGEGPATIQPATLTQPGNVNPASPSNSVRAAATAEKPPAPEQPNEVPSAAPSQANPKISSAQEDPQNAAALETNASGPKISAQSAVATPGTSAQTSGFLRIAALGTAGAALLVLLLWLFLRRSPPARRASFITRSLEREQK